MVKDSQRISLNIRDVSHCKFCTEKFTACHDRCPKDARGEFGYMAWKNELERVKKARLEYIEYKSKMGYKRHWGKFD